MSLVNVDLDLKEVFSLSETWKLTKTASTTVAGFLFNKYRNNRLLRSSMELLAVCPENGIPISIPSVHGLSKEFVAALMEDERHQSQGN